MISRPILHISDWSKFSIWNGVTISIQMSIKDARGARGERGSRGVRGVRGTRGIIGVRGVRDAI